jgi:hypothetical protein
VARDEYGNEAGSVLGDRSFTICAVLLGADSAAGSQHCETAALSKASILLTVSGTYHRTVVLSTHQQLRLDSTSSSASSAVTSLRWSGYIRTGGDDQYTFSHSASPSSSGTLTFFSVGGQAIAACCVSISEEVAIVHGRGAVHEVHAEYATSTSTASAHAGATSILATILSGLHWQSASVENAVVPEGDALIPALLVVPLCIRYLSCRRTGLHRRTTVPS